MKIPTTPMIIIEGNICINKYIIRIYCSPRG